MIKNKRYNRILIFLLVLALVIPMRPVSRANAASTAKGTVKATTLNMRKGPGTGFDKVTSGGSPVVLKAGQELTILARVNDWYYVKANTGTDTVKGYCLSKASGSVYIEPAKGADIPDMYRKGAVKATKLNVRKGPSTGHAIVESGGEKVVLGVKDTVAVVEEMDGWYHIFVNFNGNNVEGYCLGEYIEVSGEAFVETEYAFGTVNATKLNVRKGPSTDYDIVKVSGEKVVLTLGYKLTILDAVDGWYHVSGTFSGKSFEGYCLGTYISLDDNSPIPGDAGQTDKEDKTDQPGATENESGETGNDNPGSGEAQTPEDGPYVPLSPTDLSHGVPEGYELATMSFSAKYAIKAKVNAANGLNLRVKAGSGEDVISVLQKDTEVTIINTTSVTAEDENGKSVKTKWYKVVADIGGEYRAGYVVTDYLTITEFEGVTAKTSASNQVMRKSLNKKTHVTTSSGKTVKLAKSLEVKIIGDATAKDGTKFFKVEAVYKKKTFTGFIPAMKLALCQTQSKYNADYLVKKSESGDDSDNNSNTETEPDEKDDGKYSFIGANAKIKEAAGLTVRVAPSNSSEMIYTSNGKAVMLYTGDSVEIVDVSTEGDFVWCYVRFYFNDKEYKGYIRSTHVDEDALMTLMGINDAGTEDEVDFETRLDKEGFPESYKQGLRELHELYPLWEFKAFHTGLDWNEAVQNEAQVGKSLLPNTRSLEWLSFEPGAYSWKTDTFTVFDAPAWVAASEDAVRYFMDPRNFLTYSGIFQFELLSYNPKYQTLDGAAAIMKTSAFGNNAKYTYTDDFGKKRTVSYLDTFYMAAEYSGVSLYHLVSRSKNEIGNNPSNSVSGTVPGYEGLYNFYNIGANDSKISGQNIKNGLEFARNGRGGETMNKLLMISWNNPFRAIMGGAYFLGYNYVNKGQNTLYFERFNVVNGYYPNYTHQYMTNVEAAATEGLSTSRGYIDADKMPLVFLIPVYSSMPDVPCAAPEKAYNPNNWLKTLKVSDANGNEYSLTPTFDYTVKQDYTLIVDNSVDTIKIDAAAVSKLATITSKSKFSLKPGINKVKVKVQAENGDVRTYLIKVMREDDPNIEVPDEDEEEIGEQPITAPEETGEENGGQSAEPESGSDIIDEAVWTDPDA